jgi:LytS/YehU family sensor histidine kinase
VADTGLGYNPGQTDTAGTGVGLANTRERLAAIYGNQAQFDIGPNAEAGVGTRAVMELPYKVVGA